MIWIYAVMGMVLIGYMILLVVRPAGQESTAIDGWGVDLFEAIGAALCVVGGRRRRPGSAIPILLGNGLSSWCLGDVAQTVASTGGAATPSPSIADVFYLLYFPVSHAAVVLLVRGDHSPELAPLA